MGPIWALMGPYMGPYEPLWAPTRTGPQPGLGPNPARANLNPPGSLFRRRKILKGGSKEGVKSPGFPETEKELDRQRGFRLTSCSNGGRRRKMMASGVRGRGYSHMNPSQEEGKT